MACLLDISCDSLKYCYCLAFLLVEEHEFSQASKNQRAEEASELTGAHVTPQAHVAGIIHVAHVPERKRIEAFEAAAAA